MYRLKFDGTTIQCDPDQAVHRGNPGCLLRVMSAVFAMSVTSRSTSNSGIAVAQRTGVEDQNRLRAPAPHFD
jgi:hypothetical protein